MAADEKTAVIQYEFRPSEAAFFPSVCLSGYRIVDNLGKEGGRLLLAGYSLIRAAVTTRIASHALGRVDAQAPKRFDRRRRGGVKELTPRRHVRSARFAVESLLSFAWNACSRALPWKSCSIFVEYAHSGR
jgi:hypothetical protein